MFFLYFVLLFFSSFFFHKKKTQRKHVQSITCPIIITIFLWYTIFSSCLNSVYVWEYFTIFLFIYAQGMEKWFCECDDNNIFTSTILSIFSFCNLLNIPIEIYRKKHHFAPFLLFYLLFNREVGNNKTDI